MTFCIVSSFLASVSDPQFLIFDFCPCLDYSAFKDLHGPSPDKFRLFSAFATFVYTLLQVILPDSFLGEISDWDQFLSIDLASPNLPIKTAADFLRNRDFSNRVAESDLPTPTNFVEQALCFC